MKTEPVISGAVLKAALVLLVAGAIGGGAYILVEGGIDLPDIDLETTTGDVTSLEETTLEDTTIGREKPEAPARPGAPFPDTLPEARKLNDCIARAGNSTDEILACLERFQ